MGEEKAVLATPAGLAELIHRALREDDPRAHIQSGLEGKLYIDGKFNLENVASRILNALETSNLLRV